LFVAADAVDAVTCLADVAAADLAILAGARVTREPLGLLESARAVFVAICRAVAVAVLVARGRARGCPAKIRRAWSACRARQALAIAVA